MSFISVLDNIGEVFQDIFKVAVPIATDLEPILDTVLPAPYADLYNEAVTIITQIEAAFGAAQAKNAGAAKMAFVVASLQPKVVAKATALKIVAPSSAQTKVYAQSVVDGLKAYQAKSSK